MMARLKDMSEYKNQDLSSQIISSIETILTKNNYSWITAQSKNATSDVMRCSLENKEDL